MKEGKKSGMKELCLLQENMVYIFLVMEKQKQLHIMMKILN